MKEKLQAIQKWVITALSLVIFLGVGHATSMLSSQQMHHGQPSADMANHCQSACPPLLKEENKTSPIREDDEEPDPLPFTAVNLAAFSSYLYIVLFAALVLAYLRQRPPDLLAAYSLRRI